MDNIILMHLFTRLPSPAVVLVEDIDAAFFRGINRGSSSPFALSDNIKLGSSEGESSRDITFSGLLAAIDAVVDGTLLFATTNKYGTLDSALTREGRLDVLVEFGNVTKRQAEELFLQFYRYGNTKLCSF